VIALTNPYVLIGIGVAQVALLSGAYLKGREHAADKCAAERAEAIQDALDEIERDRMAQGETATGDREYLASEMARLRRLLNDRSAGDVQDGRNCIVPADADGMRDDYNAIFEKRLQAGSGLDGGE